MMQSSARGEPVQGASRLLSDAVTASDIASVVARATGIPVQDMLKGERQRLLHLEGWQS